MKIKSCEELREELFKLEDFLTEVEGEKLSLDKLTESQKKELEYRLNIIREANLKIKKIFSKN